MEQPQPNRRNLLFAIAGIAIVLAIAFFALSLTGGIDQSGGTTEAATQEVSSPTVTSMPSLTPTPTTMATPTPTATPTPSPTPTPTPSPRDLRNGSTDIVRIWSDDVRLNAKVIPVYVENGEWEVAAWAAGWHYDSALPGEGDNIVMSGHNNTKGEVFRYLEYMTPGQRVYLQTADGRTWTYEVFDAYKVLEKGISREEAIEHAKVMNPTPQEQLTLITCWPYDTYTHRIIVLAKPVQ